MVVLPAPFGPEEAEDLALVDVEVDIGDAAVRAVGLGELSVWMIAVMRSVLPAGRSGTLAEERSTTVGTSCSTKAKTSRSSSSRRRGAGGRSAMAARPRSAISRKWR